MDQFTRCGDLSDVRPRDPWRATPRYVSADHDPRNEPYWTLRREFLDHVPFWNTRDLERKLRDFKEYYNHHRAH